MFTDNPIAQGVKFSIDAVGAFNRRLLTKSFNPLVFADRTIAFPLSCFTYPEPRVNIISSPEETTE